MIEGGASAASTFVALCFSPDGAVSTTLDAASDVDPGDSSAGADGGVALRSSEKSTPASEAPQVQRARSGGFSCSQTGQMRT